MKMKGTALPAEQRERKKGRHTDLLAGPLGWSCPGKQEDFTLAQFFPRLARIRGRAKRFFLYVSFSSCREFFCQLL